MGEKLARIMEANWLQSRNEPLHLDIARQSAVKEARPEARISLLDDEVPIPQFDTGGKMGDGLELRDQPGMIKSWRVDLEWLHKNVRGATAATNLCIVTGFGDSMRPMFNPGDPLLVDRGVVTADYDAVYFFRVDGEGFIKRLQKIPGKGLMALSENPAYQAWVVEPSMDFEVFGRVLKVWRSEDF
ncbi:DNA polymerase V subunit UmuD [Achromobacter sp. 2789STDY5608628]|nr:DNA polymerase V subunit UmuD [Achromobacter sp. 2789STDY5608628]